MEQRKQTAVEWLESELERACMITAFAWEDEAYFRKLLEQAKQIQKDQHCTTWYKSIANDRRELHEPSINFKQYYNENYGKEDIN
jgi:hypothetical protein